MSTRSIRLTSIHRANGLSFLIDKIKNHPMCSVITLEKGERSELANLANELL